MVFFQIGIHPLFQNIPVDVPPFQCRGRQRLRQGKRLLRALLGERGQTPRLHREHHHQNQNC